MKDAARSLLQAQPPTELTVAGPPPAPGTAPDQTRGGDGGSDPCSPALFGNFVGAGRLNCGRYVSLERHQSFTILRQGFPFLCGNIIRADDPFLS